jgi:hypothetical protein
MKATIYLTEEEVKLLNPLLKRTKGRKSIFMLGGLVCLLADKAGKDPLYLLYLVSQRDYNAAISALIESIDSLRSKGLTNTVISQATTKAVQSTASPVQSAQSAQPTAQSVVQPAADGQSIPTDQAAQPAQSQPTAQPANQPAEPAQQAQQADSDSDSNSNSEWGVGASDSNETSNIDLRNIDF